MKPKHYQKLDKSNEIKLLFVEFVFDFLVWLHGDFDPPFNQPFHTINF